MKRLLILLITVILLLCSVLPISVAAGSTAKADGLEVSIKTNKDSYSEEQGNATVTITNTLPYPVDNLIAELITPDNIKVTSDNGVVNAITVEPGDSYVIEYSLDIQKTFGSTLLIIIIASVLFVAGVVALIILLIKYKKLSKKALCILLCLMMLTPVLMTDITAKEEKKVAELSSIISDKTIKVGSKEQKLEAKISYDPATVKADSVITFETNGGSELEPVYITKGEFLDMPLTEKDNCSFIGWYTDEAMTELYNFSQPVSRSCTLYARWVDMTDTTDTDGDKLTDPMEESIGTDKNNIDTDGDGLDDYTEVVVLSLDPLKKDSDGNGIADGDEDTDGDGITNIDEVSEYSSDPGSADSDNDGLGDYDEIFVHNTDVNNPDTDGDGAYDGTEINYGTNPNAVQDSFSVTAEAEDIGDTVRPSVDIDLTGDQLQSLSIEPVKDNTYFNEEMTGYLGKAYDFNVAGEFDSATIRFEYDSSMLSYGSEPVICYFNEENWDLEALPTTVSGGVASANVEHFSTYVLVDRTLYEESLTWIDVWDASKNYTDVEIVLVMDASGSMDWNDPRDIRIDVARDLVNKLPERSKIGLVRFESDVDILTYNLTDDKSTILSYLTSSNFRPTGGTYMYSAINNSFSLFKTNDDETLKMMVILSDGDAHDSEMHDEVIQRAIDQSVKLYTIGLGDTTDYFYNYLSPLAYNTDAEFYFAANADDLYEVFDSISEKIDLYTDSDSDGVCDYYEDNLVTFAGQALRLDKNNPDTDGDGVLDGKEVIIKTIENDTHTQIRITGKYISYPFAVDSDGDGINDAEDDKPLDWNVTHKDLAHFSALSYNGSEMKEWGDAYGYSTNSAIINNWMVVEHSSDGGVFSATAYKSGNSVVIAYSGVKDTSAWMKNILCYGFTSYYAEENMACEFAALVMSKYYGCDIYITGHSLGGYFAQIATAYLLNRGTGDQIAGLVYFNAPGINMSKIFRPDNNTAIELLTAFGHEDKLTNGKVVSYALKGDWMHLLGVQNAEEYIYDVSDKALSSHGGGSGDFRGNVKDMINNAGVNDIYYTVSPEFNSISYIYEDYGANDIDSYNSMVHDIDGLFAYFK